MNENQVLDAFRDSGALLEGHFELRSGLHSDCYFQCALVLRRPRLAASLCKVLSSRILEGVPDAGTAEAVMAPAMGGIVVGHEVARNLGVDSIFAEKQDGNLVLRRFKINPGGRYIVAEDVVTRGGRVQETIDIVLQGGGQVMAIGLLVNRSGGKASFPYPTFSLLEMDPVTYDPKDCPLCRQGLPLVHPGS